MADFLSSNSMLMLERAMNFQWTKQRAITDNVVNAETPDYKTKYVTFEEALRKNIWAAAQRGAPLASMREAIGSTAPKVRVADDETARMDGNGVNVAEQQIELVRNAFQIQHVYRAISSDMSRLLMAIRGQ
ncbi:MAG: flagellar basal body rod protein FlgB [Oscillospiraceae bacterium]|nr:flagellar basal body rod protein FlgB [Oscillospiraceae bacterium]